MVVMVLEISTVHLTCVSANIRISTIRNEGQEEEETG